MAAAPCAKAKIVNLSLCLDAGPARLHAAALMPTLSPLLSERLMLCPPSPTLTPAVLDFFVRNQAHLAPWDPPQPADVLTLQGQARRMAQALQAFRDGQGLRYWLCMRAQPERVVGTLHFSAIARGPFQNTLLGYSLDQGCQGQGLMGEALARGLQDVFSGPLRLHRVQAAVQPVNRRSSALLQRLGFRREGLAPRYLFIAGAWRDHEIWSLLNPDWPDGLPPVG